MGFRLLTEPASLKQIPTTLLGGAAEAEFPAPHRAGLIEAGMRRFDRIHFARVSGSSQSRPH